MWNDYETESRFVDPKEREADLAKIAEFQSRAEEIEAKMDEIRKVLADDFMQWSEGALRKYQYDSGINIALEDFKSTAGLSSYSSAYDFWLPSNVGC